MDSNLLVPTAPALREITTAAIALRETDQQIAGFENISAGSDETLTIFDIASVLTEHPTLEEAAEPLAARLRRLVPFALAVFFSYDDASDELVARHSVGEGGLLVQGLRIPLGQRLSGWVAANRQTIVNSDAMLDLGEIAKSTQPRLRTCLSTPLVANDHLLGVLTIYSSTTDGFTEDHRRLLETAARYIGPAVRPQPRARLEIDSGNTSTSADTRPEGDRRGPSVH